MSKVIKFFIKLFLLIGTVGMGYLAMREWQRNKPFYKSRLVGFKNKVRRELEVGREAGIRKVDELFEDVEETTEAMKQIKPVKKAVEIIEKALSQSPVESVVENPVTASKKLNSLTPRQNVVYAIIKGKKQVEMKDLLMRVSGVTERTLRRDLLKLQALKLISKKGTTKSATYVLN